jgi:ADP-heptose:LPS heptosyltransferase
MGEELVGMLKEIIPIKNLCGRLKLTETAGILLQSELVFATESAMAHLSVALRRPTIAILGGGHYGLFAPWGTKAAPVHWISNRIDCYGCNWSCIYDSAICIHNIPPAQIIEKSLDLLSRIHSEK